ncbi:MAG: site-specific integrase, partial [Solibacillus sp.]
MDRQSTEALEQFIRYVQLEKNFSLHTVREYEYDLIDFFQFLKAEGVSNIVEIDYIHARLYVTKLYDEQKARTSISRKISSIRSFFRFLNREQNIDDAPFRSLYHPKKEERLPSFFYEEELNQLFEKNKGTDPKQVRNMALLELLYATGIRVSECVSVELGDIDFHYGIIRVMGKGRKERIIPFGQYAQDALISYMEQVRPRLMKNQNHQKVFVNMRGGELTARGVRYILSEMIENT